MTKDEALRMALEAFDDRSSLMKWQEARDAVKEVLEQPEQEPHSWYSAQEDEWMTHKTHKEHERLNSYTHKVGKFDLALYTTPPQPNAYDNMLKAIDSMRPAARVIQDKPATWWLDEFEKVVRNLKDKTTY